MYMPQGGLWEQSGIGSYDYTGNWTWEFYPPPYDFLAPKNSSVMPAPILYQKPRGMGCGCAGKCGGCGGGHAHTHGMGLFDSMDFSTWGVGEWGTIALGAYLLIHVLGDVGKAKKAVKRRTSKSRRKRQLKDQLSSL